MGNLRKRFLPVAGAIVFATCSSTALEVQAEEPFYKGKRLTMLINFGSGGGVDVEGRLFARYLTKHIEGRPTIVVQNMPGGAGLNAVNYLGEVAPKDGTTFGYFAGVPWQYATEPEKFRIDLKSYEFVAYEANATVFYARTDIAPGIKEPADIATAKGIVSGGLGASHPRDLGIRLTLDMLGVPYRHVSGYQSTQTARLAFQRNEINFFGETTASYRTAVQSLVNEGHAVPIYFSPSWNGEALSVPKQLEGLPILPFQEVYRKVKGTSPSGQLWEAYLAALALTSTMARLDVLPPNAPQGAVVALRNAVQQLKADREFQEEAMRTIGYVPEYEAGPDTNRQARLGLTVDQSIKEFVAGYIKRARK